MTTSTKKPKKRIGRLLVAVALMAALTAILAQRSHSIGGIYFNLGDVAVNMAALALGPWLGALVAAGGMATADVLGGFSTYAPATFVVRGLQAITIGLIARKGKGKVGFFFLASVAGGAVVVAGYFIFQVLFLKMGAMAAVKEAPFSAIQALTGLVGVLVYLLAKALASLRLNLRRRLRRRND